MCASSVTESARSIPAKSVPADGVDAAATPYAPSTWSQTSARLAHVRERVDRVDRAGQRRPRRRDDGDGRDAGGDVGVDRLRDRLG